MGLEMPVGGEGKDSGGAHHSDSLLDGGVGPALLWLREASAELAGAIPSGYDGGPGRCLHALRHLRCLRQGAAPLRPHFAPCVPA